MTLEKLSGETLLYPIIGDPIGFVKLPQRLTAKFEDLGHCMTADGFQMVDAGIEIMPNFFLGK